MSGVKLHELQAKYRQGSALPTGISNLIKTADTATREQEMTTNEHDAAQEQPQDEGTTPPTEQPQGEPAVTQEPVEQPAPEAEATETPADTTSDAPVEPQVLGRDLAQEEFERVGDEIKQLDRTVALSMAAIEVLPPTDEEVNNADAPSDTEATVETLSDQILQDMVDKGLLTEARNRAMLRLKNRDRLLKVVQEHDQLTLHVVQMLHDVGVEVPVTAILTETREVKSEKLTFQPGNRYSVKDLVTGMVYATTELRRWTREITSLRSNAQITQTQFDQMKELADELTRVNRQLKTTNEAMQIRLEELEQQQVQRLKDNDNQFVLRRADKTLFIGADKEFKEEALKGEASATAYIPVTTIGAALKFDDALIASKVLAKLRRLQERKPERVKPKNVDRYELCRMVTQVVPSADKALADVEDDD